MQVNETNSSEWQPLCNNTYYNLLQEFMCSRQSVLLTDLLSDSLYEVAVTMRIGNVTRDLYWSDPTIMTFLTDTRGIEHIC